MAVACLLLMAVSPPALPAETGITVIPLKHRLPSEVIAALQPHLEPGETVSGHDTRLVLQALPQRLTHLLQLIDQLDTTRRSLRISVRQTKEHNMGQQQLGVSGAWQQDRTRIVISSGSRSGPGEVAVRRGSAHDHLTVRTSQTATSGRNESDLSLLVLDGGYATLRAGESLPQVQPYLILAGNRLAGVATVQVYDVTTGFDVQPRLMGDRVHLALNPRLVFRTDQGNRVIQFHELRTEIVITPGEWVDLGDMVEHSNDVNRQILASRRQQMTEDSRLMVRVDPL